MKRFFIILTAVLLSFCSCEREVANTSSDLQSSSEVSIVEVSSENTSSEEALGEVFSREKAEKIDYDYERLTSLSGLNIVNFGDSIFGNFRGDNSVTSRLASYTGATCYNAAIGGATWGFNWKYKEYYTMHRMASYISTDDFTQFECTLNDFLKKEDPNSYIFEVYEILSGINWEDIDVITIAYGTNDFTNNGLITGNESEKWRGYFTATDPENNITSPCEHYYLDDAIKYSLNAIRKAYPHIRIVVLTPTPRYDKVDSPLNAHGYELKDYCEHIKVVCEEWGVPCLDAYNEVGINDTNYKKYFSGNDLVHLNPMGRDLLAKYMADNLLEALNAYCE